MAHVLFQYDGLCRNIHGHSYNLEVTLIGDSKIKPGHPKDGMVLDFGDLKKVVKSEIVNRFDHALMVSSLFPKEKIDLFKQTTERIIIVDFQPTSENIVSYIATILQQLMPTGVSLFSIRLFETVTSFAEWFASDN